MDSLGVLHSISGFFPACEGMNYVLHALTIFPFYNLWNGWSRHVHKTK